MRIHANACCIGGPLEVSGVVADRPLLFALIGFYVVGVLVLLAEVAVRIL